MPPKKNPRKKTEKTPPSLPNDKKRCASRCSALMYSNKGFWWTLVNKPSFRNTVANKVTKVFNANPARTRQYYCKMFGAGESEDEEFFLGETTPDAFNQIYPRLLDDLKIYFDKVGKTAPPAFRNYAELMMLKLRSTMNLAIKPPAIDLYTSAPSSHPAAPITIKIERSSASVIDSVSSSADKDNILWRIVEFDAKKIKLSKRV